MSSMQIQVMMDQVFLTSNQSQEQVEVVEEYREKTAAIEQMFLDLETIWESREIYCLHWAFKNASTKFSHALATMEEYAKAANHTDQRLQELSKAAREDTCKAAIQFQRLSQITMALDIFISVTLILGVTLIAQSIEEILHPYGLVVGFIGVIAMAKVSLDRFVIIPYIDNWGWNRYHTLTHAIELNIARYISMKLEIILTNLDLNGRIAKYETMRPV